jgi:poly-gamma-glutamate capsule biosynthesis protein CapA/YwtB (metallophosphatase superfamily)/GMP synthase-like glutamine amidotransferase
LEIGVLALVGGLLFFSLTIIRCTPVSFPSPTATPSPNPTLSPTSTPTSIPISTSTSTPTLSPSPTPSLTSTTTPISNIQYPPTPSPSLSPSPSPSPSITPSPTPSPSPSPTPTPVTPRILIIEHAEGRAAGVADYLTRLGLPFDRLEIYVGDPLPPSEWGQIIVLSGGPMSPHDVDNPAYPFLHAEADFLRQALVLKLPILGLCLGHQLLAHLLGGEVAVGDQEVGWLSVQLNEAGTKDPLFAGVPQEFFPFHYHVEQAVTLPPEATVLASSPLCAVQAFRYGQAPVWGVQFHPEIGPQRGETILRSSTRLSLSPDEVAPMIERGYQVYGEASERILYNFFREAFAYYGADAAFPPPPSRPLALREGWRFQTWGTVTDLAVADLNGDDRAEVLIASLDKHAYAANAAGQPLWKHPTLASVYVLHVVDLDGQPTVLVGSDDNCLYALDSTGRQRWQYCTDSRITALSSSTKLQYPISNTPLILAASWDGYVHQVNPDGILHQRYPVGEVGVEYPSALDSAPDGTAAIATNKGGLYLLSPTGDLHPLPPLAGYVRRVCLADLDDDGQQELVAGSSTGDIAMLPPPPLPELGEGEGEGGWGGGGEGHLLHLPTCSITDLAFADLDGDRSQEILVACGGPESGIYTLSADGTQHWRYETPTGVWAVAVEDLDNDTWPEVVIGGDDGTVRVLDRQGRVRGSVVLGGLVHGLRVHDLEGDGQAEILARTGWQVYALTITPAWELSLPSPNIQYPIPNTPLPPVADDEIELLAVGDIMLARTVEERMNQYGSLYPFQAVYPLLQAADIAVGNLETPFTVQGRPADKRFIFRTHPEHITALSTVGFDVLSLANNHILDFPPDSMDDTLAALEDLGIATVGAGRGEAAAHRPAVLEVKGIKVAFLAFAAPRWRGSPEVPTATDVAWAEPEPVRKAVVEARQEADLVIVILHTGTEYEAQANQEQRSVAHAAVEGGAALVIGHHPHVLQDVEVYQGVPIVYSLGNFVFDMDVIERTRDTAILRAVLAKDGVCSVDLYLARIVDDAQPRLCVAEDSSPLVQHIYP